jgi:hypothetical protein
MSLCLWAQSGAQMLKGDLQGLRSGAAATPALTRQLNAHVLLLAEKTHEPKSTTVQQFVGSLVGAVAGHSLSQEDLDRMAGDIQQALQSAGTSTAGFEETIQNFERRLMRVGVPAVRSHLVASSLERIGREVRGPEGAPAR